MGDRRPSPTPTLDKALCCRAIGSRLSPIASLAVLASVLFAGCGSSSEKITVTTAAATGTPPPNVVSEKEISGFPAGSPARALLQLWQAVEFSDVEGASALVAQTVVSSLGRAKFAEEVRTIGDDVPGLRVLNTREIASNASVRVYLVFFDPKGRVSGYTPTTFQLTLSSNGYRLSDFSYFSRTAREILKRRQAASGR